LVKIVREFFLLQEEEEEEEEESFQNFFK